MDGWFAPWHIVIIAVVFVLLFGAKRLPDGARSLGRSLRIFKSELRGMHEDDERHASYPQATEQVPPPLPPAPAVPPVTPSSQPVQPAEQQPVTSSGVGPTGQPPTAP